MTRIPISRVYDMGRSDPPPPEVQRKQVADAKRKAWHQFGLLVIDPEDINDDWERQALINTADKFYGRRGKRG